MRDISVRYRAYASANCRAGAIFPRKRIFAPQIFYPNVLRWQVAESNTQKFLFKAISFCEKSFYIDIPQPHLFHLSLRELHLSDVGTGTTIRLMHFCQHC
jgi:hypothetical protein